MDVPLFPLHTVLCPGVVLPLRVFEPRYRRLVEHCVAEDAGFGVVLIRIGEEVGRAPRELAAVGTLARLQTVNRHDDGQFEIRTVGAERFRIHGVHLAADGYLVGEVSVLGERVGDADVARSEASEATALMIRYLDLFRPLAAEVSPGVWRTVGTGLGNPPRAARPGESAVGRREDGDEGEESEASDAGRSNAPGAAPPGASPPDASPQGAAPPDGSVLGADRRDRAGQSPGTGEPTTSSPPADPLRSRATKKSGAVPSRRRLSKGREAGRGLDASVDQGAAGAQEPAGVARARLLIPDDPTALSYLLCGIVQVGLQARQSLLEEPTTAARLTKLNGLLRREIGLLGWRLRPLISDPRLARLRRN